MFQSEILTNQEKQHARATRTTHHSPSMEHGPPCATEQVKILGGEYRTRLYKLMHYRNDAQKGWESANSFLLFPSNEHCFGELVPHTIYMYQCNFLQSFCWTSTAPEEIFSHIQFCSTLQFCGVHCATVLPLLSSSI